MMAVQGPSDEDKLLITELSRGIKFAFGASIFTDGTPPVLDKIVSVIENILQQVFLLKGTQIVLERKDLINLSLRLEQIL